MSNWFLNTSTLVSLSNWFKNTNGRTCRHFSTHQSTISFDESLFFALGNPLEDKDLRDGSDFDLFKQQLICYRSIDSVLPDRETDLEGRLQLRTKE